MQKTGSVRLVLFSLFSFCTMLMADGQLLNGKYIGYEKFPIRYSSGILAIIGKPDTKIIKNEFYYEVTLSITDSFITISKIPIKFINDRLTKKIVDTTAGGYYHYSVKNVLYNFDGRIFLSGSLIDCKYCNPPSHGIPLYYYTYYRVVQTGHDLMLSSNNEENILFKRQKK